MSTKTEVTAPSAHDLAIEKLRAIHRLEKAKAGMAAAEKGLKSDFPGFWTWVVEKMTAAKVI